MRTRSCLLPRRVPVDRPSDTERGVDVAPTVLDRWSHLTWATLARLTQNVSTLSRSSLNREPETKCVPGTVDLHDAARGLKDQ